MDVLTLALAVCLGNLLYLAVGVLVNLALRPMRVRRMAEAQAEQLEAYRRLMGLVDPDVVDADEASPYL